MGERHSVESGCYLLSEDSVLLFPRRLAIANVCPEQKILFAGEGPGILANKSAHLFTPTSVLN